MPGQSKLKRNADDTGGAPPRRQNPAARNILRIATGDDAAVRALKVLTSKLSEEDFDKLITNTTRLSELPISSGCTGSHMDLMQISRLLGMLGGSCKCLDIHAAEWVPCQYA